MSSMTKIDHLVIGAISLAQGVDYVKKVLGVNMPFGGVHEITGTHNHLMQLGDSLFLEVIALNPQAANQARLSWYGLDNENVQCSIKNQPRLLTWVVNTADISALIDNNDFNFGKPTLISRGRLSWYFGLPDDGNLFEHGTLPYVLAWNTNKHPAANMVNLGCKLKKLDIYHPNADQLEKILSSIGAVELVYLHQTSKPAHIIATIDTPSGLKQLNSLSETADQQIKN